jgi:hypothetical protein
MLLLCFFLAFSTRIYTRSKPPCCIPSDRGPASIPARIRRSNPSAFDRNRAESIFVRSCRSNPSAFDRNRTKSISFKVVDQTPLRSNRNRTESISFGVVDPTPLRSIGADQGAPHRELHIGIEPSVFDRNGSRCMHPIESYRSESSPAFDSIGSSRSEKPRFSTKFEEGEDLVPHPRAGPDNRFQRFSYGNNRVPSFRSRSHCICTSEVLQGGAQRFRRLIRQAKLSEYTSEIERFPSFAKRKTKHYICWLACASHCMPMHACACLCVCVCVCV